MTQHDGAGEPQAAEPPPVFRFNGYGVPVDAFDTGAVPPEPDPDPTPPYSYDYEPYGPAVDPYVEHVPYDQPVAAYSYRAPVEPTPPTAPADPPTARGPEAEPAPAAWFEPIAEPPPAPAPASEPEPEPAAAQPLWRPDMPRRREPRWRPDMPTARFEPGPAVPLEPEARPAPIGSVPAYAEQPYVHAHVTAEAAAEPFTGPAPMAWPATPWTEQPAVPARQAYRPQSRAAGRVPDEARERTWALVSHIGGLLTGFLLPLVTFVMYRKRSQFLREHTTEALNFQLMLAIVYVAGAALTVLSFGVFVLAAAWMFAVTCGTLGALAANDGDRFRYPVNLRVIA